MISISHKYKLIFIHIPKAGGNSANKWMKDIDEDTEPLGPRHHEPVRNLIRNHPQEIAGYKTFAIVRNPWARVVSLYHYRKKAGHSNPPHWPSLEDIQTMSFEDVVHRSLEQNPDYAEICPPRDAPETAWLEPSCFAWLNVDGKVAVDYVCRLETIERDLARMCQDIGIAVAEFPNVNVSEHDHYSSYYDAETRGIVARKYEKDIRHFGYEFEDRASSG